MSKVKQLFNLICSWEKAIYAFDNHTVSDLHAKLTNKGHEGNAYLTFIMEHYDNLPDIVVFLHAARNGTFAGWHNDAPGHDNLFSVQNLRLNYVLEQGYVNLRCSWTPGCPDAVQPFRHPPDPRKHAEPYIAAAWAQMFPGEKVPEVFAVPCCAQFAVTREQILKRPREDYERYFQWLMESELDDTVSGRVMEYLWHIIFGRNAVHCPKRLQCYCNTYGMCSTDGEPLIENDDEPEDVWKQLLNSTHSP